MADPDDYNKLWRLANPGYHKAKAKEWRAAHPANKKRMYDYRHRHPEYRELENWRDKCRRAGVIPPPEAYKDRSRAPPQ